MSSMMIIQEVDKCIRCNGCVIGCKRTWKLKAANDGVHKIAADHRVMIKSQKQVDMGPFVRYSCWHCPSPACAGGCPFKAIYKHASGAVVVDHTKCDPLKCTKQCQQMCLRGGYPRIAATTDLYPGLQKMQKCTMCFPRAGVGGDLPSKASSGDPGYVADEAHQPTCVYTCPAKAMMYKERTWFMTVYARTQGYISVQGQGNMYWVSKKSVIVAPKADPFVEDHISPMVGSLMSTPFSKAALVSGLVVGAVAAVSARRAKLEAEEAEMSEEAVEL